MQSMVPNQPKLILSDVDSTLTGITSWYSFVRNLGGSPQVQASIYQKFHKGELTLPEANREVIRNLEVGQGGKVTKKAVQNALFQVEIQGEAFATFEELKKMGYRIALISGAIDILVESIAQRLGADYWYSNNKLVFDANEELIDIGYTQDESGLKVQQLEDLVKKSGLKKNQIIAIGDDKNDVPIFEQVPGIAIGRAPTELAQIAWQSVEFLPRTIQILLPLI